MGETLNTNSIKPFHQKPFASVTRVYSFLLMHIYYAHIKYINRLTLQLMHFHHSKLRDCQAGEIINMLSGLIT